jgi:BolA family transcriptional regulator, general stress-responsive regulator
LSCVHCDATRYSIAKGLQVANKKRKYMSPYRQGDKKMSKTIRMQRIQVLLENDFNPIELLIIDESHQHHGHGGWREEGETHLRVKIVAQAFGGLTRVSIHRLINNTLTPFFEEGLHALAIEANAPQELIFQENKTQ